MSAQDPFDPWIRDKMKDWSAPVADRIWNKIQEDQEKKRGFWFWFNDQRNRLSIIGTLLLITTGIGIYLAAYTKQASTNFSIPANQSETTSNTTKQSKQIKSASAQAINLTYNISHFGVSNSTSKKKKAIAHNAVVILNKGETKSAAQFENDDLATQTFNKNSTKSNYTSIRSKRKFKQRNAQIGVDSSNAEDMLTEEQDFLSGADVEFTRLPFSKISKPALRVKSLAKVEIPCPPGERHPRIQYLEVYGGTDLTWRQFSDVANSNYQKLRESSTQTSLAYNLGLRYVRVFKNNWLVRAGLHYGQINERFNFKEGNVIQTTFIINNNGDTTGSYQTSYTRFKTTYNRYRTFDLPISIGRQFAWEKWKLQVDAGALINLRSINTGEVLSLQGKPVSIQSDGTDNPYQLKQNIGIGWIASVGSYYQINDQWALFGETNIRYNPSSMTQDGLSLKQKFHTCGIRLGVRLNLTPNQQK